MLNTELKYANVNHMANLFLFVFLLFAFFYDNVITIRCMREGFKETFKPLIKSQDSIKKSIDEQQDATIAQLKKKSTCINIRIGKD